MARIKYYNTTTQQWEYADGIGGGGIGVDISSLKRIFNVINSILRNVEYTEDSIEKLDTLRSLISALDPSTEYDVEQVGDKLIIRAAPAHQVNQTLFIT